jgi:hypothetical protein
VDYTPWTSRHPYGHVLRVQRALQGHPESPSLWERHVTAILKDLSFVPTTHEPCIYGGTVDGHSVLFLRQVDDFAISFDDPATYEKLCDLTDTRLNEPIKRLGLLRLYNGTNIEQTRDYVRLHSTSYIDKILAANTWLGDSPRARIDRPVPMNGSSATLRTPDNAPVPSSDSERESLQRSMGFPYRKAIGDLIWAMVTCHPDLSFAVIELRQFSNNPADAYTTTMSTKCSDTYNIPGNLDSHTGALHHFPTYPTHRPHLPSTLTLRTAFATTMHLTFPQRPFSATLPPTGPVTSAIAALYRALPSFSPVLLSPTNPAFIRSILNELHVPQHHATLIYEDNEGSKRTLHSSESSPSRYYSRDLPFLSLLIDFFPSIFLVL